MASKAAVSHPSSCSTCCHMCKKTSCGIGPSVSSDQYLLFLVRFWRGDDIANIFLLIRVIFQNFNTGGRSLSTRHFACIFQLILVGQERCLAHVLAACFGRHHHCEHVPSERKNDVHAHGASTHSTQDSHRKFQIPSLRAHQHHHAHGRTFCLSTMASSSSTTMDAADEAGGETIFSSDGMDPLPLPTVPIVQENVYEVLETDAPLVSFSTRRESPEQRLQRLTKEVNALQQELKDNEQVSKLARQLSSRLEVSSSISALERSIHQRGNHQDNDGTETTRENTTVAQGESSNVEERLVQLERLVGASSTLRRVLAFWRESKRWKIWPIESMKRHWTRLPLVPR